MPSELSFFRRARYFSSVTAIYLLTLLFASYVFYPSLFTVSGNKAQALQSTPITTKPAPKAVEAITGIPIRLVVPSLNIDLPIDKGVYNPDNNSWTLSRTHAQFAELSSPANDQGGNTFIYGHRNKYVFLRLYRIKPAEKALVYTSNNHVFSYSFSGTERVAPSDVSIFNYLGPPILTIQTCSGDWNEWRQLFKFDFEEVTQ